MASSRDDDALPLAADRVTAYVSANAPLSENSHQGVSAENPHSHLGCEAKKLANALGKSPAVRWERAGACCTGRENDGTGLYFYRARYYSPTFQRFIAQDPIGFAGGNANLYVYAKNNPLRFRDPYGRQADDPCNPEDPMTELLAEGIKEWSVALHEAQLEPSACVPPAPEPPVYPYDPGDLLTGRPLPPNLGPPPYSPQQYQQQ